MTPSDAGSKSLSAYERPSVAVDTAVLTATREALFVVLTRFHGDLRLPGTFLHTGETLAAAVRRSLSQKVGLSGLDPQQLHVFDDPTRDSRGWVLSVAHVDVVPYDVASRAERAALVPLAQVRELPFDHEQIVGRAVDRLRAEYRRRADPRRFLGERFTLRDLQQVHEAVAGEQLRRETFRKRMLNHLSPTEDHLADVVGRPPRIYEHRPADDQTGGPGNS
jgi:ADP-ribose pyrophosphatase YjhB (NUDIX family)